MKPIIYVRKVGDKTVAEYRSAEWGMYNNSPIEEISILRLIVDLNNLSPQYFSRQVQDYDIQREFGLDNSGSRV